jgi:3-methyladenine DNA glycosylase AlkD
MGVAARLANDVRRDLARLPRHDVPSVRVVRRRYTRLLRLEPARVVLEFTRELLADGGWEERVIAWEVIASHPTTADALDDGLVDELATGLSDWAAVDHFGVTVLGRAWRDGRVSDAKIDELAHSPDRWRRRLALVATVPLNLNARGGKGDARRTLRVCRQLLADRDDMVVKALSWALRELAKRFPANVQAFITKNESRLAPRVRREVANKLKTGLKSPRRAKSVRLRRARVASLVVVQTPIEPT